MDVVPDEIAVRRLFAGLTAGQPDAPAGRYAGIRRRFRRHRITQAVGTLAVMATAAVVAAGIAFTARPAVPDTGPRSLPAWALPWPDHRDGSVPQRVLDNAVLAWRHLAALDDASTITATKNAAPIWYVGQTVDHGEVVAVIFEAKSAAGRRLVAGWATASEVMHGQSGWSRGSDPWVFYDVAAPKPTRGLFIGLNLHGTTAQPGRNPDNWIVVLTDPRVQDVGWTAPGPGAATISRQGGSSSGSEKVGLAHAVHGLVIVNTGQIAGKAQVTQLEVHPRNLLRTSEPVGVPGSAASEVPQLGQPKAIPAGHSFRPISELTGQGTSGTGLSGYAGRLAIRARCYGRGNLRVTFGTGSRERPLGTIPCDDAVHELSTQVLLRPTDPDAGITVHASALASYRVVAGTVR
jgi:hypothetical protein